MDHNSLSDLSSPLSIVGSESFLIDGGAGTTSSTSTLDDHHEHPEVVRLAVAMSAVNFSLFAYWLYCSSVSPMGMAGGLVVGASLGFALGGRVFAAVLRRVTRLGQGLLYPLGILLGNLVGFAIGGLFAVNMGALVRTLLRVVS